jgi:hypothetical protein
MQVLLVPSGDQLHEGDSPLAPLNTTGTSFTSTITAPDPRLIASVSGLEKQGKNHFAFTAPGPIACLSFDTGTEGVIEKFRKGFGDNKPKDIYLADYDVNLPGGADLKQIADAAQAIWVKFRKDYEWAIRNARTVVADTGTEIWEILRIARFGKLTQVMPHQYGPVNAEFRKLVKLAFDVKNVNAIWLHKLKAEYDTKTVVVAGQTKEVSNKTGKLVRSGFGDIPFLVQFNAVVHRDSELRDWDPGKSSFRLHPVPRATDDNGFRLTVLDSRHNGELSGTVLEGELLNFPQLAALALDVDIDMFMK